MSKNQQKPKPPETEGHPESLDKVRDILFGGQMRLVEGRLQALEERIQREQQAIRTEFTKRCGELEAAAKKDLETLNERLGAERTKRAEDLKALAAECKDSFRAIEKRHAKLEEIHAQSDAELRDQLLQVSSSTSDEIKQLSDRLTTELSVAVTALESEKLDTVTLSDMLTSMASALVGDGRKASKKAARG